MKNKFLKLVITRLTLCVVFILYIGLQIGNAQNKSFIREYTYQASELDSKITARNAATNQMRSLLLKEIGEFLYAETTNTTNSLVKNGQEAYSQEYTERIKAITSGFVEMKVLQEEWNGATYYIKAEMTIDPESVNKKIAEALESDKKTSVKLPTQTQETLLTDIEILNLGDGRYFGRTRQGSQPLNGEYRIVDGQNSAYSLISFNEGLYNGKYQLFEKSMVKEEGTFSDGRKNGLFKEFYHDGTTIKKETPYAMGKIDGVVKSYFTSGRVEFEKSYSNGVEHGMEKRYHHTDGHCTVECYYQNGKLNGKDVRYITSRIDYIEIKNYKNGTLEGAYSRQFINKNPYEQGKYANGKKEGVWILFTEEGDTSKFETFKDGVLNGLCVRYLNGKRQVQSYFSNDILDGVSYQFNQTGDVTVETNYKNGKKDGVERQWFTHIKQGYMEETTYIAGRKNGPFKSFYLTNENQPKKKKSLKGSGLYENNRRVGLWTTYNINGETIEEWNTGN